MEPMACCAPKRLRIMRDKLWLAQHPKRLDEVAGKESGSSGGAS